MTQIEHATLPLLRSAAGRPVGQVAGAFALLQVQRRWLWSVQRNPRMANDAQEAVGTWTVKFKQWTWEYTLTADGRCAWRDPMNGEKGSGRWGVGSKVIYFNWTGSPNVKESWECPISDENTGWYDAPYGKGGLVSTRKRVAPDGYTGSEPSLDLPSAPPPENAPVYPVLRVIPGAKPVYDQEFSAVIGFMYQSDGYMAFYDVEGRLVGSDEIGLDQPLLDPIDFVMIAGGIARGVGKAIIKTGMSVAASAGAKAIIRGLTATVAGAMRSAFRAAVSGKTLKFTATTISRMSTKGRYVPVHVLKMALRYGTREAGPQGVKGAFQYTLKIIKSEANIAPGLKPAASWGGKTYTLKLVVKEELTSNTVLHFHYQ